MQQPTPEVSRLSFEEANDLFHSYARREEIVQTLVKVGVVEPMAEVFDPIGATVEECIEFLDKNALGWTTWRFSLQDQPLDSWTAQYTRTFPSITVTAQTSADAIYKLCVQWIDHPNFKARNLDKR